MLLYGAGGHAKVVIDCLISQGVEVEGIFDDKSDLVSMNGYDVLGRYDESYMFEDKCIITIGDNIARKKVAAKIKHAFGTAIHTSAQISPYAKIGAGSVVFHNSVVQTGARVGKHSILNTNSLVDYDTEIGDFVHISPNVTLCNDVKIGDGTHLGAGSTILPNISVGKNCIIGAGAVITQNLEDYSLVVGVPGKVIRKLNE